MEPRFAGGRRHSPDGAHYAYTGAQNDAAKTKWAVVDGRQVKYFGDILQFTPAGGLLSIERGSDVQSLILNGKPVIQAVWVGNIWISPAGALVATVVTPKHGAPMCSRSTENRFPVQKT